MKLTPEDAAVLGNALVWLSKHHVPFMELPEIEFWFEKNSDLVDWTDNSIDAKNQPKTKEMVERYLNAMDVLATVSLIARLAGSKDPKVLRRLEALREKYLKKGGTQ
jgi:hypothetical protein